MTYLTPKDVSKELNINIATARKMFHFKTFPRVRGIGSKLLVEKESFEKFIKNEEVIAEKWKT